MADSELIKAMIKRVIEEVHFHGNFGGNGTHVDLQMLLEAHENFEEHLKQCEGCREGVGKVAAMFAQLDFNIHIPIIDFAAQQEGGQPS